MTLHVKPLSRKSHESCAVVIQITVADISPYAVRPIPKRAGPKQNLAMSPGRAFKLYASIDAAKNGRAVWPDGLHPVGNRLEARGVNTKVRCDMAFGRHKKIKQWHSYHLRLSLWEVCGLALHGFT